MTKRQKLQAELKTKLQTILVSNGYLTNLGSNVTVWNRRVLPEDTASICDLRDIRNVHDNNEDHTETLELSIYVAYRAASSSESAVYTNLTKYIQDVLKCFEDNEGYFATTYGYAVFTPVSEEIEIDLDSTWVAEAEIRINFTHSVEEKWRLDETVYS